MMEFALMTASSAEGITSGTTGILLSLSIALLAGLLLSRLAKKIQLPAVTAYLVAGVLIGPFALGALGVPGIGITASQVEGFGIIADVATLCAKHDANIVDITQSVLSEYFAMIMLADIRNLNIDFAQFVDLLAQLGTEKNLVIHTMHEDIFNTMHHI